MENYPMLIIEFHEFGACIFMDLLTLHFVKLNVPFFFLFGMICLCALDPFGSLSMKG